MVKINYLSGESISFSKAADILDEAISNRNVIIVSCRCSVKYYGRSRSILSEGDRFIIVKEDGAVLIHRPSGYSPVNWQPSTISISFSTDDDSLLIKAVRVKPRETMEIGIKKLYSIMIIKGFVDEGKFTMYVNEQEIKDILEDNPWLIEKDLKITGREVRIPEGVIDLVGKDFDGRLVIIEVKDERAGTDSAKQLLRYVRHFLRKKQEVRGILVAPSFSKNTIEFLIRNGLEKRIYDADKFIEIIEKKSNSSRLGKSILDFIDERHEQ